MTPEHVFSFTTASFKGYTLAHHAVLCPHPAIRRQTVGHTRALCNPLRRCHDGMTATETLEGLLQGTVVPWDVKRLLKNMRKDQDAMTTFIHRDAVLLDGTTGVKSNPKKGVKRPRFRSPFHELSDDICRLILSFV